MTDLHQYRHSERAERMKNPERMMVYWILRIAQDDTNLKAIKQNLQSCVNNSNVRSFQ